MSKLIDFILHIDSHLQALILQYGTTVYVILFAIIFIETGLVIMPFLPGDSLLFAAGSFAAQGSLNLYTLLISLTIAAILGDTVNYLIGKYFGHYVTKRKIGKRHLLKPEHIEKTEKFFAKYGEKAIIIARFVPIVRTVIPFVAGIGNMKYKTFITYNVIGGILRIFGLTLLGYFFGSIPFVQAHFEKVIIGIILISILPIIIEVLRAKFSSKHEKNPTL